MDGWKERWLRGGQWSNELLDGCWFDEHTVWYVYNATLKKTKNEIVCVLLLQDRIQEGTIICPIKRVILEALSHIVDKRQAQAAGSGSQIEITQSKTVSVPIWPMQK